MADRLAEGTILQDAMHQASNRADGAPRLAEGDMSSAAHIQAAHEHVKSAGQHLQAAADIEPLDTSEWEDGRSLPAVASPPSSGYAQNRTGFRAGTGAARAFRAATGRR